MNIARKLANILHYLDIQDETLLEDLLDTDPELAAWWDIQKLEDELARKKAAKEVQDAMQLDISLSKSEREQLGL